MNSFFQFFRISGSIYGSYLIGSHLLDHVKGEDEFSKHTNKQHWKYLFSGMHEPYIPTEIQVERFKKNFPQLIHLLSDSQNTIGHTPVKIRPLSECPVKMDFNSESVIAVGGAPALISSANQRNITYINNEAVAPISNGSAFHLEWDSPSEGPTSYKPSDFMIKQIFRALKYESLSSAEKTGHFSWRSLDLLSWITHPSKWATGVRVALAFQKATQKMSDPKEYTKIMLEVAKRSESNRKFYEALNRDMGGTLLLPGTGSIIVARTKEEEQGLFQMKTDLKNEGKILKILSRDEMVHRYNFIPQDGRTFGEKTHDKVLVPTFMKLVAERIRGLGGCTFNGVLTTIYTDNPDEGGIVKVRSSESGKDWYLPFSLLVLSLGGQQILDRDNKPLFDVVVARGVSALALAYFPKSQSLPPVLVCGGTNHATVLSGPVEIEDKDGKNYNGYLLRMTAGACITPINSNEYDGVAATGLIAAVRRNLGCEVEILSVRGCNRQVSQYGQTHWISPKSSPQKNGFSFKPRGDGLDQGTHRPLKSKGILIQMGAGGGGLTQAPSQPPSE